jgi:hypothetical protein
MIWSQPLADLGLLDRNLIALSTRHPNLASIMSGESAHPDLSFIESRNGPLVPVLSREGRPFPMHSRFDPVNEGQRIAADSSEGYIVAFGLGAAYHLNPLLKKEHLPAL